MKNQKNKAGSLELAFLRYSICNLVDIKYHCVCRFGEKCLNFSKLLAHEKTII
jgi:hypothetical protein